MPESVVVAGTWGHQQAQDGKDTGDAAGPATRVGSAVQPQKADPFDRLSDKASGSVVEPKATRRAGFWIWASKSRRSFRGGARRHVAESSRLRRGDGNSRHEAGPSDQHIHSLFY